VLDVHEQELWVLLLMVEAEVDHVEQRRSERSIKQLVHRSIDVAAVPGDLVHRRTGQKPADRATVPVAALFVVGVEEVAKHRVEHSIARKFCQQQRGLGEPRRLRPVPHCRAGVRHRLSAVVLGREWCGRGFGRGPDLLVAPDQLHLPNGRADVMKRGRRNADLHCAPFRLSATAGEPIPRRLRQLVAIVGGGRATEPSVASRIIGDSALDVNRLSGRRSGLWRATVVR
jgi:hypothetical protein